MERQGTRIAETILIKKNKFEEFMLTDFQTYSKGIVIIHVWYWQKGRHTDQWNKTEFRNRPKHIWSSDFKKENGAMLIWHRKDGLFNKRCRNNWTYIFKKMNLDLTLIHYTKFNSK